MKNTWLICLCAIHLLIGAVSAQRDYSKVQIKPTKLTDRVYMLEGSGGNIGVSIGEDGVLIIDDQFAPLADKIKAALGELGGADPAFILNTHHHGDHTGGNPVFGETGVIVAHENVRKRLLERRVDDKPLPRSAFPEITYKKGLTVHFNGEAIAVVHFPKSHTDGDGVVFFKESNVVHTGDLFFNKRFPYIDLGSGGSVQGVIGSVTKLLTMIPEDWQIIPGHGDLASHTDLNAYLLMLESTSLIVRSSMNEGKTLEECQSAGLPDKWASWGEAYISNDRWISIIYNSYSKKE
jgi:cyclase